jgi:ketosteroid isomerase-like protein
VEPQAVEFWMDGWFTKGGRPMFRKQHVLAILVVAALMGVGACQTADAPVPEAESRQEFVETALAFEEAFQAGDVEQIIEFYAPDAVSLPPGYPPSVGREAIETDLRYLFDEFALDRSFELVDYQVEGDYATRLGEWTQTLKPEGREAPAIETGNPASMLGAVGKVTSWAGWTRMPTPGAVGKVTSWAGWTHMPTPGALGKVTSWAGWTHMPTAGALGKVTSWAGWTRMPTPQPDDDYIVETGRCMLGWSNINGEWKVVWEIWNTF